MQSVDWGLAITIAGLICTVVLGVLAIWLSLYLYTRAKDTETSVDNSLAAIKQQTNSLEKLASKQMDRLIGAVTERPELQDQRLLLIELFKVVQKPAIVSSPPQQAGLTPETIDWLFRLGIATYYYSGFVNLLLQPLLPVNIADAEDWYVNKVDASQSDFMALDSLISSADQRALGNHSLYPLYQEASSYIKPFVRTTTGTYQAREQQARAASTENP